jgi:hypothetical protein
MSHTEWYDTEVYESIFPSPSQEALPKEGSVLRLNQRDKKQIFELFAQGFSAEDAAEILGTVSGYAGAPDALALKIRRLFEEYLMMPIWEKLSVTLMVDQVSSRQHRLMDDISDLKRIDTALDSANERMVVSLLDLKRKIRERMAREHSAGEDKSQSIGEVSDDEIEQVWEKISARILPKE